MPKNNKIFKRIALLCMALLVVIIAWGGLVPDIALSQQVQSRLNALQSEFYRLESRLNRIEAQLDRPPQRESSGAPAAPAPPPLSPGQNGSQLSREQMFDRLATLVIELKQQVNELEARVSKLESRKKKGVRG